MQSSYSWERDPQYQELLNPPCHKVFITRFSDSYLYRLLIINKVYFGLLVVPSITKHGKFERVGMCAILREPQAIGQQSVIDIV